MLSFNSGFKREFLSASWIIILFFFLGFFGFLIFRVKQVESLNSIPFVFQKTDFQLRPPELALTGVLSEIKGEVKKQGRSDQDFKDIKNVEKIVQGDALKLGKNAGMTLDFDNFAKLNIGEDSEVSFVDLLPSEFLVRQINGIITYNLLDQKATVSLRGTGFLFTLMSGAAQADIDKENANATIDILEGEGKVAVLDLDEETKVWEVKKGQRFFLDFDTRNVSIR